MPLSAISAFQTDLFIPQYRPSRSESWEMRLSEMNLVPGYWSGVVLVRGMAALLRDGACR